LKIRSIMSSTFDRRLRCVVPSRRGAVLSGARRSPRRSANTVCSTNTWGNVCMSGIPHLYQQVGLLRPTEHGWQGMPTCLCRLGHTRSGALRRVLRTPGGPGQAVRPPRRSGASIYPPAPMAASPGHQTTAKVLKDKTSSTQCLLVLQTGNQAPLNLNIPDC